MNFTTNKVSTISVQNPPVSQLIKVNPNVISVPLQTTNIVKPAIKNDATAVAIKSAVQSGSGINLASIKIVDAPTERPIITDIVPIKPAGIVSTSPGTIKVTAPISPNGNTGIIPLTPIGLTPIVQNPITANLPVIKNPATITAATTATNKTVKTQLYDDVGVLPNGNVWVDGKAVAGTDINGKVELKNINDESQITFSFVGYKSKTFIAKNVPTKVVLEIDENMLDGVSVKNTYVKPAATTPDSKKPNWFWWILALAGVVTYAGYKYSVDKKTQKIVKTKI